MTHATGTEALIGVVEDSDEDFLMLQRGFERHSEMVLRRWHRAEAALLALEQNDDAIAGVDVLVVDLTLGAMDGFEFIRRVRLLPGGATIPICVLSGSERSSDVERATQAGADHYVVKPKNAEALRTLPGVMRGVASMRTARHGVRHR